MKYRMLAVAAGVAMALGSVPAVAAAAPADVTSYQRAAYGVDGVDATTVEATWVVPDAGCGWGEFTVGVGMTSTVTGIGHTALVGTTAFCDYGEIYYAVGIDGTGAGPVRAGDVMHGTVTSKGNGLFALTLENRTAGWTGTGAYQSQDILHPRAIVTLGLGLNAPDFPPVTVSATVDGKPLAERAPTRLVLVSSTGAPVVEPGPFAPNGDFAFTRVD